MLLQEQDWRVFRLVYRLSSLLIQRSTKYPLNSPIGLKSYGILSRDLCDSGNSN